MTFTTSSSSPCQFIFLIMATSERYSFSLTTFSPSGKLVQIEYALAAVAAGGPSVGIKAVNGTVIAAEKKQKLKTKKLFSTSGSCCLARKRLEGLRKGEERDICGEFSCCTQSSTAVKASVKVMESQSPSLHIGRVTRCIALLTAKPASDTGQERSSK